MQGRGPPPHKRHKTAEGFSSAPPPPPAYAAVRDARLLFYQQSMVATVEARLAANLPKLSALIKQIRGTAPKEMCQGLSAESNSVLLTLSSGSGSLAAARAALLLAALLDDVYMELLCDDLLGRKGGAPRGKVPLPHEYLAALVASAGLRQGNTCSECAIESGGGGGELLSLPLCRACSLRNPQLAYLRLRAVEAGPGLLDLPRLTAATLSCEGVSAGPAGGGTMRGTEPLGCATLRRWQESVRVRVCAWSSFACPDAASAAALAAFCCPPGAKAGAALHEAGAGTGYWAAYLRQQCGGAVGSGSGSGSGTGLRVVATDARPVDGGGAGGGDNEYHSRLPAWSAVGRADAARAAAAAGADGGVLFLCYPPPCLGSGGGGADVGLSALAAFERSGGTRLALAGEMRGDTGSAALERRLAAGWVLARAPLPLPAYGDTAAALTLWRRRGPDAGVGGDEGPKERASAVAPAAPAAVAVGGGDGAGPLRVRVDISGQQGQPLVVAIRALSGAPGAEGRGQTRSAVARAKTRPTAPAELVKAVGLLRDTPWLLDPADVRVAKGLGEGEGEGEGAGAGAGCFVSLAEVKDARREAVQALALALAAPVPGAGAGAISSSAPSGPVPSRGPARTPAWPLCCVSCGAAPAVPPATAAPMLRDRLTRAVVACGSACAQRPAAAAALEAELALRHLPPLAVWRGLTGTGTGSGAGVGVGALWKSGVLL